MDCESEANLDYIVRPKTKNKLISWMSLLSLSPVPSKLKLNLWFYLSTLTGTCLNLREVGTSITSGTGKSTYNLKNQSSSPVESSSRKTHR